MIQLLESYVITSLANYVLMTSKIPVWVLIPTHTNNTQQIWIQFGILIILKDKNKR